MQFSLVKKEKKHVGEGFMSSSEPSVTRDFHTRF